jgi:hypothetical protein
MVTLGVILGIEGLILLIGGMRVISKKRLGAGNYGESETASPIATA